MRFAVLADIHGNVWALDAILKDLHARGIVKAVNLGDCFYGPLAPHETAERLLPLQLPTVRGNQDRGLLETDGQTPLLQENYVELSSSALHWLRLLPLILSWQQDILLCHGTPASDTTYLLEEVTENGVYLANSTTIASRLCATQKQVILCAHTHVARTVLLPDGRLVVNPGSVGLPAYTDDLPFSHAMESGSPHARYAIISQIPNGWNVEHIEVVYEWERAAEVAARRGRPDWAEWLLTGRAAFPGC